MVDWTLITNFHSFFSLPPPPSHIQDVAENLHQLLIVLLADQRHIVNVIAELITLSKPVHTRKKKKKIKKSNLCPYIQPKSIASLSSQLHKITQILLHTPSSAMNVRNSLSSTRGCSRWSLDARFVAIRLSVLLQSCQKQQRRLFTILSNTCWWFRGCTCKVTGQWPDEEAKSSPPHPTLPFWVNFWR